MVGHGAIASPLPTHGTGFTPPAPRRHGEVAGAEIVGTEVGQLAFQAFDVQPQRLAMAEQQKRAAAGGLAGMEFDPDQFQRRLGLLQIDVARLAGQNAVEAQRRDRTARLGSARQRLLPVQPVMPTTSRFSSCRQTMSEAWTRASCTWADMTARSSASSAISLSGSGAGIRSSVIL